MSHGHQYLFLSDLRAKFEQHCPEDLSEVMPCSEAEISALEQQFFVKLPRAYHEFLLWMGRGGGLFLRKHYQCGTLSLLNDEARKTVARKKPSLTLPNDAFVFTVEMSESFYFFRCGEGDNPKVYIFMDEEEQDYIRGDRTIHELPPEWAFLFDDRRKDFGVFSPSFTEYLSYEMDIYIKLKQEAKAREQERLKRQQGEN